MHIEKQFITEDAQTLLETNPLARIAYDEITDSINNMIDSVNNSSKNCNGVVPIKENCYKQLEEYYQWYREKPLNMLSEKGGPIDVYKLFRDDEQTVRVGLEFETGNISSAHRSMNKLLLGLHNRELELACLIMPVAQLSYYLTDRVSNYEELQPYFPLVNSAPFILIGFDVENYDESIPSLPKGRDGMSKRSIRKWKNRKL